MTEEEIAAARDAKLKADAKLPSDEQVERAAKLAALAHGDDISYWPSHAGVARVVLTAMMNESAIILGVFP